MTWRRWAWLLVLAAGLVVGVPAGVGAQLNPCSPSAPAPRRPDTGMPGWFATTPADPPPSRGPATPPEDLYATYGTAGLWWPTWDLGCSGSAEGIVTDMANLPMDWSSATLNGTASIRTVAWDDDWLAPLDETVAAMTDRLSGFYRVAMGLALGAVGVWILFRARTAEYGEITTASAWAVLMIALAALALSYPVWAGRTYDDVVIGSARLVNDTLAGEDDATAETDPAVAQINSDVAYRVWLRGMFGSDTTRTAETFGPRFYSAMAFSWSELPTLDRGGPEAEALVEAHRRAFVDAARELEQADPSAYRTMQGKGAFSTRIPTGLLGWILVTSLCFMAGVAAALVLVARLVGRGLIMALPVVIPFGTLYRWSGPVRKLGGIAQAVVVALITATLAGGLLDSWRRSPALDRVAAVAGRVRVAGRDLRGLESAQAAGHGGRIGRPEQTRRACPSTQPGPCSPWSAPAPGPRPASRRPRARRRPGRSGSRVPRSTPPARQWPPSRRCPRPRRPRRSGPCRRPRSPWRTVMSRPG